MARARNLAWVAANAVGIPGWMRRRHRRDVLILMYHALVEPGLPFRRWTHLDVDQFEWQMSYLRNHYEVLPLREVVSAMQAGKPLPDHVAAVTFDDGFRSTHSRAFPILVREGIPATIFLSTGLIDAAELTWTARLFLAFRTTLDRELSLPQFGVPGLRFDSVEQRDAAGDYVRSLAKQLPIAEKNALVEAVESNLSVVPEHYPDYAQEFQLMSWPQVAEMHRSGLIDFGAHSVHHEILSKLPVEQMRTEVIRSCEAIRDRIGRAPMFAYPNGQRGDFCDVAKSTLREADAICGLSTIEGLCSVDDDLFELKRIGVGNDVTRARFAALCSGLESGSKRRLGRL